MTKKRSRLTCDNMEELVYLHEVCAQVREWDAVKKICLVSSVLCLLTPRLHLIDCDPNHCFLSFFFSLYIYTYAYTYFIIHFLVLTKPVPASIPVKASFSTSDTIVTLYRYRSMNRFVSLPHTPHQSKTDFKFWSI